MAIVIDNPALEQRIATAAEAVGASAEQFAKQILERYTPADDSENNSNATFHRTLADALGPFIGSIEGDYGDLSANTSERFVEILAQKHRDGRI